MPAAHLSSPCDVIAAVVRAVMPGTVPTAPVTAGLMPGGTPDYRISVLDSVSLPDGRDMSTGQVYTRPGVQIRVRALDRLTAAARARALWAKLQTLVGFEIEVAVSGDATETVEVGAVSAPSDPIYLGLEPGGQNDRHLYAINLTYSLRR